MSDENKIDWKYYGIYDASNLPTNWQHVLTIEDGAGYEWTTFHAFYSPTSRRFFWSGGSGCSCTYWGQDIKNEGDFEDGDREALSRAIRAFVSEYKYLFSENDLLEALSELRRWKPQDLPPPAPAKFRKKPVVIEAMHLTGSPADWHAVYQWIERNTLGSFEPMAVIEGREVYPDSGVSIDPRDGRIIISTLEGLHWADPDDWIIRGVKGEFYPCKPDIFEATYEQVDND